MGKKDLTCCMLLIFKSLKYKTPVIDKPFFTVVLNHSVSLFITPYEASCLTDLTIILKTLNDITHSLTLNVNLKFQHNFGKGCS